jgi:VWFA-related protein
MEVEVKVTDKHGQPVPDLKPVDFTLLEDGEPQTIRTFEYVTEPGSDRSVKPDSWVYVTGQVNHEDRKRTWREMNKFLDESLRPGVLVSIEDSGFTSNRADLQTALQELMEKRSKPGSAELPSDLDTVDFGSLEYEPEFQSQVDSLNESFANLNGLQANYRGDFFLYRYIDLVRSLSVLPGKKVVVLLTRISPARTRQSRCIAASDRRSNPVPCDLPYCRDTSPQREAALRSRFDVSRLCSFPRRQSTGHDQFR